MKRFLFILLLLGSFPIIGFRYQSASPETEVKVYICDSPGGKKYHYTKDCRGLSACKHEIKKVTIEEAKKKGKKELCGWED